MIRFCAFRCGIGKATNMTDVVNAGIALTALPNASHHSKLPSKKTFNTKVPLGRWRPEVRAEREHDKYSNRAEACRRSLCKYGVWLA